MAIKINIKKNIPNKLIKNYVFFTDGDFKINGLKDLNLGKDSELIKSTIKSLEFEQKKIFTFQFKT